ncbi:hypothetical protein BMF94_5019 [Rhodotorula taiwanensis]|uniref:Uncharacterized protein n=1 Tax=Rhodotorula taiwanensis TaxID=741276 RepID=A0A2S5B5F0_9BASI|nr:hypothetical protein BMF94_5019 [Rhodotorula taiwanensis]
MPLLSRTPSYSNGPAPRTRRGSHPKPLSMAMPPAPPSFSTVASGPGRPPTQHLDADEPDLFHIDHAHHLTQDDDGAASTSPQLSAAYFRRAVHRVHDVLYGGRGKDRTEIDNVVRELYDTGAAFENPLTLARGKPAIADMFALLALVPGSMWSEMGEVTHSHSAFDGSRLVVFSHTLHISLLSFLERESAPPCGGGGRGGGGGGSTATGGGRTPATPSRQRSYSFFSLPGTPFPQTPSAQYGDDGKSEAGGGEYSPGIFSKSYAAMTARDRWPAASLLRALSPRAIASSLATLHLKLHTRLVFNEEGRIIAHEDMWGLKEIVEGVFPLGAHLYSVNRQGLGWIASIASRILVPKPLEAATTSAATEEVTQAAAKRRLEAAWDEECPPDRGRDRDRAAPTTTAQDSLARYHQALMMSAASAPQQPHRKLMNPFPAYGTDNPDAFGAALGLDVGQRAKPTTMEDE